MRTTSLAALAGALIAAGTLAAPAHAEDYTHRDATRDVYAQTYYDSARGGGAPWTKVRAPETDAKRVEASHTRSRVRILIKGVNLTRRSEAAGYSIRTPSEWVWVAQRIGKSSRYPRFRMSDDYGNAVTCRNADHDVNRKKDTAWISVPRTCLGNPSTVRIGAELKDFVRFDGGEQYRFDDALADGAPGDILTVSRALSPGR